MCKYENKAGQKYSDAVKHVFYFIHINFLILWHTKMHKNTKTKHGTMNVVILWII